MSIGAAVTVAAIAAACSSKASTSDERESRATAREVSAPPADPEPMHRQADPPAGPGSLGGALARGRNALLATWVEPVADANGDAGAGRYRVRFARFTGGTWSAPTTIAEGASVLANWADTPSVARGGDGALIAHWARRVEGGPYAYHVALARSADDGSTWTPLGLAHDDGTATEHGFVSLVPVSSGVRAFWLDGREMAVEHGAGSMTLRTALVADEITEGAIVDPRVCDCCSTSAVATDHGSAIAYRNRSDNELRDIWIARQTGDGWSAPSAVHEDNWKIEGCPVNGPALDADREWLAVAWYTYARDRASVRVAFSDDAGASFADPVEIDGPRGTRTPIGRVDLELIDAGEAIVTWMSSSGQDATVFARRVTARGRVGTLAALLQTTSARSAGFPRIARAGDALALIYTDPAEQTRVRFRTIPLRAIPAATAKPPAPKEPAPPTP